VFAVPRLPPPRGRRGTASLNGMDLSPITPSPAPDDGWITVTGAHLHNLRHVSTRLPRGKLVAFTGISGSGKSSLAFGSLHGEAQRRYLESIAPFARRLIGSAISPQVEAVHGLPPTVALEQRRSGGGARSTVGTVTSLSNTIRLLYSRVGDHPADVLARGSALHSGRLTSDTFSPNTTDGMCPTCHGDGVVRTPTEDSLVPDASLSIRDGAIAAWPGAWLGKNFRDILATLDIDIDAPWSSLPQETRDWILFTDEQPVVTVHPVRGPETTHRTYEGRWQSVERYLRHTLTSQSDRVRRRALSFLHSETCPTCDGRRLHPDALRVTYLDEPIDALMTRPAADLLDRLATRLAEVETVPADADAATPEIEAERLLLPSAVDVLGSIVGLGLGHLALARGARTLSTGELQRLRLAGQLRAGLFGVAYVLDEPSAGLHPSEKGALLDLLERLLAEGNSVLMVEHDMTLVERADWVVDVGPGAGADGGEVLFSGPVAGLREVDASATARYLGAPSPAPRGADAARTPSGVLALSGITSRTMRDLDVEVPLGAFTALTGVSGAGKTSLIDVLAEVLEQHVRTAVVDDPEPADAGDADGSASAPDAAAGAGDRTEVAGVAGIEAVDRLVRITQKPIGRSPRSCLATYTGLFDRVRRLFADTAEARRRGWKVGRFSFNVAEGRCPVCDGEGQVEVELVFLPGSFATCPACHGKRYRDETLEITWNGLTIADVLELPVTRALDAFADEPRILQALRALDAVGLGYLTLGQPATELSGGEAQRIKLATELQRAARGHTVYLLDEPTTGLHPADVDLLVTELNRLVDAGSTVVVAEHDLRVVAQADHVLDLGPGAGADGGRLVARGAPAEVATTDTATGRCLRGDPETAAVA
jgi:excinuclease ABC subunit A